MEDQKQQRLREKGVEKKTRSFTKRVQMQKVDEVWALLSATVDGQSRKDQPRSVF